MKTIIIIVIAIILSGCERKRFQFIACTPEQRKDVAEFVESLLLDANNRSDEEMEDVIIQLETTGKACLCSRQILLTDGQGYIDYGDSSIVEGVSYHIPLQN